MAETRKAKLIHHDGTLTVVLPEDFGLEGDEVYVTRDAETGDVTLSRQPGRNSLADYIAFRDSLDIPQEDLDAYMAERPMNRPATWRNVFEDEE